MYKIRELLHKSAQNFSIHSERQPTTNAVVTTMI